VSRSELFILGVVALVGIGCLLQGDRAEGALLVSLAVMYVLVNG
jgi:hypothetical protein